MPKKKKAKKIKTVKKLKNNKLKSNLKQAAKINERKSQHVGADEKPVIKKIKKQPTEKRTYNLKDYVVYPKHGVGKIINVENPPKRLHIFGF